MLHDWFIISATTLMITALFCVARTWMMRGKSRPKLVLALILTLLLVYMGAMLLICYVQPGFRPQMLDISYSLVCIILVGLLFIYFRLLMLPWVNNRKLLRRLLYIVSAYVFLYAVFSFFFTPSPKIYTIADVLENISQPVIFLRLAAFLNFVVLVVIAGIKIYQMYKRHKINISEQFSFSENVSLSWLPYLVVFSILYGIWTVFDMCISEIGWMFIASNFIYSGFYMAITFWGIHQPDIYTEDENNYEEKAISSKGMPLAMRQKLNRELVMLMEQNCEYRNPDLRIDHVARALNTNRTYLYTIIKEDFEDNFIGLVNHYRIKEAKELLSKDNVPLSMLEISEQVGFKSISSFNTFFKREAGMNPTQYKKIEDAKK